MTKKKEPVATPEPELDLPPPTEVHCPVCGHKVAVSHTCGVCGHGA